MDPLPRLPLDGEEDVTGSFPIMRRFSTSLIANANCDRDDILANDPLAWRKRSAGQDSL
jgi:hypothetical protein